MSTESGAYQPIDQLGTLSDTWALGMAGLRPSSDFLDLVQATPTYADPQIWGDIARDMSWLDNYYQGDEARQSTFRTFVIAELSPVFARVGWEPTEGEADPVKILRTQLIDALGAFGDPAVVEEARRRFDAQDKDSKAMPAALRRTILGVVAKHADAGTWNRLHAMAKAEKTPLVKDQMYTLLSLSRDKALAQRALELALTDEPGATNSSGMIGAVAEQHPELAFDFAMAHKEQVDKKIDSSARNRYYSLIAGRSRDPSMVGKVKAFADKYVVAAARRNTDTAIANIEYRIKVHDERLPEIDAWLKSHGG